MSLILIQRFRHQLHQVYSLSSLVFVWLSNARNVCARSFAMLRNLLLGIVVTGGNDVLTGIHLIVNVYNELTLLQLRLHHEPIHVVIEEGAHWILKLLN